MKISPELLNTLQTLHHAYLDEEGREMVNPEPLVLCCELDRPLTLQEQVQRLMRGELSKQAHDQGKETFKESMDFDVADEFDSPDTKTNYEVMAEETLITKQQLKQELSGALPPQPEKPADNSSPEPEGESD